MDRNAYTARIAAGGGELFQLQYSGAIFKYPSSPCTSDCPGWHLAGEYDPAAKAIYANGVGVYNGNGPGLYKMRRDGSVFQFTAGGAWSQVEGPDATRITIAVGSGSRMASLYADGSITMAGVGRLPGDAVAIALGASDYLYRLSANGDIDVLWWQFSSTWTSMDRNPATVAIAVGASDMLYQLQNNGYIWRHTYVCDPHCRPTWEKLDNNPATVRIFASMWDLYQLHHNGSLWRYTGTPCNGDSCPGWELLTSEGVGQVAVDGGNRVYTVGWTQPVFRPVRHRVCSECL